MSLGDTWGNEPVPVETSQLSVEYWRQKATEFQRTLNAVDAVAIESYLTVDLLPEGEERDTLVYGIMEFESKKTAMRLAAEGINAAAAVINAAGGRFPSLSIPSTLGFLPAVTLPAAAIAAFTAAAGLIAWASAWTVQQVRNISAARVAAEQIADPTVRDETLAEIARIEARARAAATTASDSPLASVAGIAKWAGIAVLAYLGWQAFQSTRKA